MNGRSAPSPAAGGDSPDLLGLYDEALPVVYGYFMSRCGRVAEAEDLTSETFLAAADAVRQDAAPQLSVPWLIGVARHKLVDHWRRKTRDERRLHAVAEAIPIADDPWDVSLDVIAARQTLAGLAPHHRMVLTLRYLDDQPVPEIARLLGRTVHATEALLVRARLAFRRAYPLEDPTDA